MLQSVSWYSWFMASEIDDIKNSDKKSGLLALSVTNTIGPITFISKLDTIFAIRYRYLKPSFKVGCLHQVRGTEGLVVLFKVGSFVERFP